MGICTDRVVMRGKGVQITIVVVVYNAENYVERCLNSLIQQSDQHFRVVIVDDGSTDRSREICRAMMEKVEFETVLLEQPHRGVAEARNCGLQHVTTEYVLFLDCDDWLEADTVSSLLSMEQDQKPELIVYGFYYEAVNQRNYPVSSRTKRVLSGKQEIQDHFVALWNSGLMYSVCNKMFRADLLSTHRIFFQNFSFGEDFEFCKDVMRFCNRLMITDRCFYHYTCHVKGSLSTVYREDLFEIRLREHRDFVRYFYEMDQMTPQAEEFLARRHIERIVGCVENECSPFSRKNVKQRLSKIKEIIDDPQTASCAEKAKLTSLRMKILIFPIRKKWYWVALLFGYVMTVCQNWMPALFTWLKMNR